MENKKEPIDKAIYVAFLIIMALIFCDLTVFVQKCYLQNSTNLLCTMVLLNTIIGFLEGIFIVKLFKKSMVSDLTIPIFSICLIFFALGFATFPKNNIFLPTAFAISFASYLLL